MKKVLSLFFLLAGAAGCVETGGDGDSSQLAIPKMNIECNQIICSSGSTTVFLGFLPDDIGQTCENYFLTMPTGEYFQAFEIWGQATISVNGPVLSGSVTSWKNFGGVTTGNMDNRRYILCGHYDVDNDQILDAGEAVGEVYIYPGASPQMIDDWFNY